MLLSGAESPVMVSAAHLDSLFGLGCWHQGLPPVMAGQGSTGDLGSIPAVCNALGSCRELPQWCILWHLWRRLSHPWNGFKSVKEYRENQTLLWCCFLMLWHFFHQVTAIPHYEHRIHPGIAGQTICQLGKRGDPVRELLMDSLPVDTLWGDASFCPFEIGMQFCTRSIKGGLRK